MNRTIVTLERFYGAIRRDREGHAALVTMGATVREAVMPYLRTAYRAGFEPVPGEHRDDRPRVPPRNDDRPDPRRLPARDCHQIPGRHHPGDPWPPRRSRRCCRCCSAYAAASTTTAFCARISSTSFRRAPEATWSWSWSRRGFGHPRAGGWSTGPRGGGGSGRSSHERPQGQIRRLRGRGTRTRTRTRTGPSDLRTR